MTEEASARAIADWHSITTPLMRVIGSPRRPRTVEFRQLSGIAIWVEWEDGALWIKRFERITPKPSGAALSVLRRLQDIADRLGITLRGNASAVDTPECPDPDQDRLIAFYRRAGFSVGPAKGSHQMHYPPTFYAEIPD